MACPKCESSRGNRRWLAWLALAAALVAGAWLQQGEPARAPAAPAQAAR